MLSYMRRKMIRNDIWAAALYIPQEGEDLAIQARIQQFAIKILMTVTKIVRF
jgi:hypothetical protein